MRPIEPTTASFPRASSPVHPPTRPARTRRRLIVGAALVLLGLAGASGWIALSMTQSPPRWWAAIDATDPEAAKTARVLENGVATLLTRIRSGPGSELRGPGQARTVGLVEGTVEGREGASWTMVLKASDANAWLATRLRVWLENDSDTPFQWPEEVTSVQVRFEGGVISVGASIAPHDGESQDNENEAAPHAQVLSASLVPEFRDDGSFWLPARWVSVGRLSLPAGWMLSAATTGQAADTSRRDVASLPQTRDLLAAFAGKVPVMQTPDVRIGDGRRVRLLALDAREGKLYITLKTLPRENTRAGR